MEDAQMEEWWMDMRFRRFKSPVNRIPKFCKKLKFYQIFFTKFEFVFFVKDLETVFRHTVVLEKIRMVSLSFIKATLDLALWEISSK